MSKYYAVKVGAKTGIFLTWAETEKYVKGFRGAKYKSFKTREDAQEYLDEDISSATQKTQTTQETQTTQTNEMQNQNTTIQMGNKVSSNLNTNSRLQTRHRIYTDGSCQSQIGGFGYVYVRNTEIEEIAEPHCGKVPFYPCTNNIAELYAIQKALEMTNEKLIDLFTDSNYAIGCLTEHYFNWQRNGWRNAKGEPVANRLLIETILLLLRDKDVKFYHVYGHNGNKYNEMCDKLADQGRML